MSSTLRLTSLPGTLALTLLAACSGSSSGDGVATVSLAVTDAATQDLSTFTLGLESVELVSETGDRLSILPQPVAVDFAALGELSRLLNVVPVTPDVYTGLEVGLLYDGDRVHVAGESNPAMLVDADGNELTGTTMVPIVFAVPLEVTSGNYVIELDLDLDQSVDVVGSAQVAFEPALVPRVNRADPKEHAVGGNLRTVVLERSLFRIGLDGPPGSEPVVEIAVAPGTVFQVDGVCLLGAAGLSLLETLPPGTWVQAFGSMGASSSRFLALTVEAGTGSYDGGTDIVEGLIVDRAGGAGTDAVLTVVGHSRVFANNSLQFNLTYTVNTNFASTKVVRRGSATPYTTDALNVGQRVRMFGSLTLGPGPNVLDVTNATDVVRLEPTWLFGTANGAPVAGVLSIDLLRVDLRDATLFDWSDSGVVPPTNRATFTIDEHNLGVGKGITGGPSATPVVVRGFFAPVDDAGRDFDAHMVDNRHRLPSLLLVRERLGGFTVTTTVPPGNGRIDFGFDMAGTGAERAVIDMGFAGQTDLVPTGVAIVPKLGTGGFGFYLLYDRTLNSVDLHFTFASFAQALDAKLDGGAMLFNVGAVGEYNADDQEVPSSLVGVTVQ